MCLTNIGKLTRKIYCSLLSGAVLYVLLFMFSNCYARELTSYDIANAIYNISYEQSVTLTKNDINIAICETIANELNNHQGMYFIGNGGSGFEKTIGFYYLLGNRGYIYNNSPNGNQGTKWITYNINNKNFNMNSFENSLTMAYGRYTYNDGDLYTSPNLNNNNIYWYGDTMRPSGFNMFEENLFIDDYFSFNYVSGLNDINIDDFNTMKQIESSYNTLNYVAEFGRYANLDLTTYKPSYTIWKYEKIQNYFEPIITYNYNGYSYVNDNLGRLYLNSNMLISNTIIEINLFPTDLEEFSALSILFYITDSNTIINNGDLDINNTFNDDYYNRYNNLINNLINENVGTITNNSGEVTGNIDYSPITQKIDELTSTSGVDSTINSYLSGDYESIAQDIGYQVWENPFFTFLLNIFEDFYDALTKREDIVIDMSVHNVPLILNTRDFVTPPSILKDVIKWCMIFFYIYFNYKYFYHLVTLIQTFKINTVISKIGTDEFYDSDYM